MDMKQIDRLIDLLMEKGISEFELEKEGFKIRIRKDTPVLSPPVTAEAKKVNPAVAVPAPVVEEVTVEAEEQAAQVPANEHTITSPMVGSFYRSPSPGAKPYIDIGDRVEKGQVCCIVEAMKLMNEIVIDVEGVVAKIHVENAQPVEFGEPLVTIETAP